MTIYHAKKAKWTKDGRQWFFQIYYHKIDGKRVRYSSRQYFTQAEAIEAEKIFKLKHDINNQSANLTLGELFYLFYENQKKEVKVSTIKGYENRIKYLSMLNNIKLWDFDYKVINEWRSYINDLNLTSRTKNDIQKLLKTLLNFATKRFGYSFNKIYFLLTSFRNVNELPKEMEFYTSDEFKKYISYEDDIKFACLFRVFYYCGLRLGELKGLTWNDIDFNKRTIRINKNVVSVGSNGKSYTINSPKTKSSIRTIPISNILYKYLMNLYNYSKNYYKFDKNWYVFGNINPIDSGVIDNRNRRNAKLANLKRIRIHDFRHSCASLLINSGANITIVAKYLGHTKIEETLNTYSHMYKSSLDSVVEIMGEIENVKENL